jgi:preprotein translocase subunit SecG
MLASFIIIVHLLVSVGLILIILLQTGKGAGMGAAFGGASQTLFGSTGRATFLTKITVAAAIIFTLTSLTLSFAWTEKTGVTGDLAPGAGGITPPVGPETPAPPGASSNIPGGPSETPGPSSAAGADTPAPDDGLPDLGPGAPGPGEETPGKTAPPSPSPGNETPGPESPEAP